MGAGGVNIEVSPKSMNNMKTAKLLVIIFSLITSTVSGQNYLSIVALSGVDNLYHLDELNDSSDIVVNSLPVPQQDSFKVISANLYIHTDNYLLGPEKYIQSLEDTAATLSKYSLLMIAIHDQNKRTYKVVVKLKLPVIDSLNCLTQAQIDLNQSYISQLINKKVIDNRYDVNLHYKSELVGISYLSTFIKDKVVCCIGRSPICDDCFSIAKIETMLVDNDFSIINADQLEYTAYEDVSEHIAQYAKLELHLDSLIININSDLEEFANAVSVAIPQTYISINQITFFNCESGIDKIKNRPLFDKKKPYIDLQVIGYDSYLSYKSDTNLKIGDGIGSGTLYFINFDNNIDILSVITSARAFLSLAGINKLNTKRILPNEDVNFGKTDGIVFFGNERSVLFDYITNQFTRCDLLSGDIAIIRFKEWAENNGTYNYNPEHSEEYVALISSESNDLNHYYLHFDDDGNPNHLGVSNSNRAARLLGFFTLHVTSHMAGYRHYTNPDQYSCVGLGYAHNAQWISNKLLNSEDVKTFEDLIDFTHIELPSLKNDTNARFSKK